MPTDFDFFERSLHEPRVYRVWRGWEREAVRQLAAFDGLDILQETDEHTLIRTTNLMDPGTADGVRSVEERFGVSLPPELHQFYGRWNGGVLVYGILYFMLSADEIIQTAEESRELEGVSLDLPWHMIRFCNLGDGCYTALRRRSEGDWEIIWADIEDAELDLLHPVDLEEDHNGILDPSFPAWLRRVDGTDGWPVGGNLDMPDGRPPCTRVW